MNSAQFRAFLSSLSVSHFPLLGPSFRNEDFCHLDLSVHNPELRSVDVSKINDLGQFVNSIISNNRAKVAYGGYLEQRGIYRRSSYFNQSDPDTERNIHLGLDLWIEAGTPVYAPLDGTLHSFKNNTNFGDYGPCLILEHQMESKLFYTLYGHLSLESLEGKKEGQSIKKGERIATLGRPEVNGTYPPHLHFQIIRDLEGNNGDYPGVSNLKDLEFYKQNCPDPNLLLGL
jgi:murein DD-endopeptidase MepM/ murein hydrolase activator NlpD